MPKKTPDEQLHKLRNKDISYVNLGQTNSRRYFYNF